jgi:signal transduction histidine kinase
MANGILQGFSPFIVLGETQRIERTLATARLFLSAASLIAVWLDPAKPGRFPTLVFALLISYVIHSLLIFVLVNIRNESSPAFRLSVHAVDILWPALLSIFTEGVNSPYFIFNFFALLAAAYRWGFLETLATAAATIVFFFTQAILLESGSPSVQAVLQFQFEFNQFVVRGLYLLISGYLLGYLGEEEKRLRAEVAAIARVIAKAQGEVSLYGALREVLNEVLRMFGAQRATLAIQEVTSGRAFLWEAVRDGRSPEITLRSEELRESQRSTYLFEPPGHAWYARRKTTLPGKKRFELFVVSEQGVRVHEPAWKPPAWFEGLPALRTILGVSLHFGPDWSGQALILDPASGSPPDVDVAFLSVLARQVTPSIYSIFLMRRLRSRVGAVERARVARELHDGVIQSLIGLEMKVDVLRRQTDGGSAAIAEELKRVQNLLHQEVLNLRELMQQMRPIDVPPKRFLDYLATTVDKFGRDVGISARFVSPFDEVAIPPRICTEVARIVQEALANIRKHSHARSVLVRFDAQDGNWRLIIDDDGRGFDFAGRLTQAELDATHKGPMIIRERVRSIGGELVVESGPGSGARLEITFPRKA